MAIDTQVVELLGRQRLTSELLRDKLEVAVPVRDRGVDLIAYADLSKQVNKFSARPIQMKSFSRSGFSVSKQYERISDLIMAYVWHLENAVEAVTFALPYAEAIQIAENMNWTKTDSWQIGGKYSTSSPSSDLKLRLEKYRVATGTWWKLITGISLPLHAPVSAG